MNRELVSEYAVEVGKWREPADDDSQNRCQSYLPPGAIAADPRKQVTPHQGTNCQHENTDQSIDLQKSHGLIDNRRMDNLLKKNQPEQQPGRQPQTECRRERALPSNTKVVWTILIFHGDHIVFKSHFIY